MEKVFARPTGKLECLL